MAKNIEHIIHKKSNIIDDGKPKLPEPNILKHGELAINYAQGLETISLLNSEGEVITITHDVLVSETAVSDDIITSAQIVIDESIDGQEVEIYTKSDVNGIVSTLEQADSALKTQLEKQIVVGSETNNEQGILLIDETDDVTQSVYTKAEVDAIIAKLKTDNNLK